MLASFLKKLKKSPRIVKIINAEYWSSKTLYWLLSPVLIWNAWRAKSLTFFTAVNPTWKYGGLFGESKKAILDLIADEYKPITLLVEKQNLTNTLKKDFIQSGFLAGRAFIAKPIFGERGDGVSKIESIRDLILYNQSTDNEYIIQEFVDYPIELGIFYSRKPSEEKGRISSVTLKEFLSVTGDGKNTLCQLVQDNTRAYFQEKKLKIKFAKIWNNIVPYGETIELENIGNHCRGTRFINANYLITRDLENVFEKISHSIDGFQYGRFDLRVSSLQDLYEGKNIKIMELNGTNSEPTHVYDATHGFFRMYRDFAWHWTRMADIAIENQKNGVKPAKLIPFFKDLKNYT